MNMTNKQFEDLISHFKKLDEDLRYLNCENSSDRKRTMEFYKSSLERLIKFR